MSFFRKLWAQNKSKIPSLADRIQKFEDLDTKLKPKENEYRQWLQNHELPLPSAEQIAWHNAEIGMFCHFSINTYYNHEWSDGTLDPINYNPKNLDCEQWVQVAQKLGAKYIILVAKHHDGFCNWQTNTTDYSVKSTPFKDGKGDVVEEFLTACKKYNMNAGLYCSPWDRHEPKYKDKEAYDKFYAEQLTELCTLYNTKLFEIWFDGAGSTGREYDWDSIIGVVRQYQPQALIFNMGAPTIRWTGNEEGFASDPNWNVLQIGDDFRESNIESIDNVGLKLKENDGFGNKWVPAECDLPIRNHTWFYNTHNKKKIYSLKYLIEMYEKSVGHGANMLINLAPNREGLIDQDDALRATELGNEIRRRYVHPIVSIENEGEQESLELTLNPPQSINAVMLQEDIQYGERIRKYKVEGFLNGKWEVISMGMSIGHKKIDPISNCSLEKVKVTVLNSLAPPKLLRLDVFSF